MKMISRRNFCKFGAAGVGAVIGGLAPLIKPKANILIKANGILVGTIEAISFTDQVKGNCRGIKFSRLKVEEIFPNRHIHAMTQQVPLQLEIQDGLSFSTVENLWLEVSHPIVTCSSAEMVMIDSFPFEAEKLNLGL